MLKPKSLIFAPLEGITDALYRELILEQYPEWDLLFTDFYRIPRHPHKSIKLLKNHIGLEVLSHPEWMNKTVVQVLTTSRDAIEKTCEELNELQVPWLDLNAGCPMRKVISHRGGSYLLSDLPEFRDIVKRLRKGFPGFFSVKIRIGFKDDKNFYDILQMLQDEGIDTITLHGRLQTQLYLGRADWSYIKSAKEKLNIPLVANGDIWTAQDAQKVLQETSCDALMLGRPAMKAPWLAKLIKNPHQEQTLADLKNEIGKYLFGFYEKNLMAGYTPEQSLRRIKSVCPKIFESFLNGTDVRTKVLRSENFLTVREGVEELVPIAVSE